jgi:RNA polymerase sigma-70 factor (ECF subfamily)
MNERTENDLLVGARRFDAIILEEIYDLYITGIFAYAYHLSGDSQTAEDCVSETFVRFLKALRAGAGPSDHLKAYLYRIAHNWITDRFRRETAELLELSETLSSPVDDRPELQVETNLEMQAIRRALLSLTSDQQQVIALRYLEGWENCEVAAAMQRPEGAVKALQHRALASLKRYLCTEINVVEVPDEISIYG